MRKKIVGLLMVSVLMVGCGGTKSGIEVPDVPQTGIVQGLEPEKVPVETVAEEQPVEEKEAPVKVNHTAMVSMSEEVGGVKITGEKIVEGKYAKYALEVTLENTNDKEVTVWSELLAVNGSVDFVRHMIPLKAGEVQVYNMDLRNPEITEGDFDVIQEVQLELAIFGESLPKEGVRTSRMLLQTEEYYGELDRPNEFGHVLFVDGGLSIYGKRVRKEECGMDGLRLLVINDIGGDVVVRVEDSTVNGEYIGTQEDLGLIPAYDYGLVYDEMDILMMQKYGIEEIEDIKISFGFYSAEDGEHYYSTELIEVPNY